MRTANQGNRAAVPPTGADAYWRTARRWLYSPLLRTHELRFFTSFWKVRNRWQRFKFFSAVCV